MRLWSPKESYLHFLKEKLPYKYQSKMKEGRLSERWKQFTQYSQEANRSLLYLILVSIFLLLMAESGGAFNIAPKASYVASIPYQENQGRVTYFGYSVALLPTDEFKWLLVGAPRANSSSSPGVHEPGSFFRCPFHAQHQHCEEVVLDTTENYRRHSDKRNSAFRNNSWTGAAIDIDEENNVIVCAPRWKTAYKQEYRMNGLCYLLGSDLTNRSAIFLAPLAESAYQIYNYFDKGVFNYAHGQSGFDVHVTASKQLLIGAPGVLNWQGSVVKESRQANINAGGYAKREASFVYTKDIVPNPIHTSSIRDSDFFGYSVTSGVFTKVANKAQDVYFVGGAPRGARLSGMVLVFLIRRYESQPLFIKYVKEGKQVGEYFGASVAALDLNNDGLSDLVVGAPLHSSEGLYDVGCVYVFPNNDEQLSQSEIKLLGDIEQGARFGTTLGTPGDLDNDGFEDLLVGAPYENEKAGAVYVFMGSRHGIKEQYSQKLIPHTVSLTTPLKGFGISFSRPFDLDNNNYPDFAVGSFLSDAAVVMLTRPVILATGRMNADPPKLQLSHTKFLLSVCITYRGNKDPNIPRQADFVAKIELRQESLTGEVLSSFSDTGHTEKELRFNSLASMENCTELIVNLQPEKSDPSRPISVKMDFRLRTSENKGPEDPVLSLYNPPPPTLVLSFITGCKSEICESDLRVSAKFKGFDDNGKLLVGKTSKVVLDVDVWNVGEPAFLPNVTVIIPHPIMVLPTVQDCSIKENLDDTEVVCQLRNPLKLKKDSLSFDMDVMRMDDTSPDIEIEVRANSAADNDTNPKYNIRTEKLKLEKKASIKITGWSDPEQFTYERLNENEMKTNGTESMKHIFWIEKSDETPVRSVEIEIAIPNTLTTKDKETIDIVQKLQNELVFHAQSVPCQISDKSVARINLPSHERNETTNKKDSSRTIVENAKESLHCSDKNINCSYIHCTVGPWNRGDDVATITVSFDVNFTVLGNIVSVEQGFSLSSFAEVKILSSLTATNFIGKRSDEGVVETLFYPGALPLKSLAWWIYLLAILGGLLLLLLIAYILYKVGFFKRKDKIKLQTQKGQLARTEN